MLKEITVKYILSGDRNHMVLLYLKMPWSYNIFSILTPFFKQKYLADLNAEIFFVENDARSSGATAQSRKDLSKNYIQCHFLSSEILFYNKEYVAPSANTETTQGVLPMGNG